jgi:hypothetical protein
VTLTTTDDLAVMTPAQLALFAAGCAERAVPVYAYFGGRAGAYRAHLAVLHRYAAGGGPVPPEAVEQVWRLPPGGAGDSNAPGYYAMRAVAVLAAALAVGTGGDPVQACADARDGALDLAADLDFELAHEPASTVEIDPGQPRPAGDLERQESAAQERTAAAVLDRRADPGSLPAAVRQIADATAGALHRAAEQVAERRGWRPDTR